MRDKPCRGSKESDTKKRWREKGKKSKAKSTLLVETYWPKVIISRDARICIGTGRISKAATSSCFEGKSSPASDSKEITNSEVIEHLCCEDNAASFEEEKTICPISSSTEIGGGNVDAYGTCEDYIQCKDEKRNVKIVDEKVALKEPPENNFVEQFEYANCNSEEYDMTVPSTIVSTTEEDEEPMFVDLTNDESKVTWKQSILKRFSDTKDFTDISGETAPESAHYDSIDTSEEHRIMIADSSSRLHRGTTSGSLATALRDRGPCVIPVQPNRSLPIRPAPPAPTRCSRKDRSPILKLSNGMLLDVMQVESMKPNNETHIPFDERKRKEESKDAIDSSNFIIPQILSIEYLGGIKRKVDDNEREKEGRENQKRRKSHEADSSQSHESCAGNVSKDAQRSCYETAADKSESISPQRLREDVSERKCASIVVSTTNDAAGRGKDTGNKVVPPLRLKKIIRAETEGYRSLEESTEAENESNYRIVTGATPQPESRSTFTAIASSWNNVDHDRNFNFEVVSENSRDNGPRRSPAKSDGYKLKYRRNRLRQKLRELRTKALQLAEQMANSTTADNSSPYESTRLRQAMNRYEKQIENLSKLLNKLSTANPMANDVINVDDENEAHDSGRLNIADTNEVTNGEMISNSPSPSPEPPKLSPRSPLNYDENRSPTEVRNSPPLLPRVCLDISTNLDPDNEDLHVAGGTTWTINETPPSKVTNNADAPNGDAENHLSQLNYDNVNNHVEVIAPISSSTIDQETQCSVTETNVDRPNCKKQSLPIARSSKIIQYGENEPGSRAVTEKETQSESAPVVNEVDKVGCFDLTESANGSKGPIVNSVVGGAQVPASVRCEVFVPTTINGRQQVLPSTMTNVSQSQSSCSGTSIIRNTVLIAGIAEDTRNSQKVTSSSGQCVALHCMPTSLQFTQINAAGGTMNQQCNVPQKHCETDGMQNEFAQRKDDNRIMTEQFPTLGNWVARMSKKQLSKSKSKLSGAGAMSVASTGDNTRITAHESQRKVPSSTANGGGRNNVVNVAPQWNNERWQRQQRQQQFLQQVVAPTAPVQPLPTAPSLRPNICPPISMTQFYPNSYAIDPYGGAALSYHSAMCPYGTYPYHPRLHPPLPGYHLPLPDTLTTHMRPLQHMDKRFPPLQEPIRHFPPDIVKYSNSLSTGSFQHSGNLEFDRLRGPSTNSNVDNPSCLPSLLVPPSPSTLPSTPQTTLPCSSLGSYPTSNGQYTRSRMIPDVVAAAAAAAVVAAASLDRQRDATTSYNRAENEVTPSTSLPNVIDGEATHSTSGSSKTSGSRESTNQEQGRVSDFGGDARLTAGGFQHIQNLLMDRLPFIRDAGGFRQSGAFGAEAQSSVINSVPYVSGLEAVRVQSSKDVARGNARSCETPHLGKVDRSPNTVNTLACSSCGITGSMFKCLGCESAFYCNERCQARHWSVHVEKCPKKMPKLKKIA